MDPRTKAITDVSATSGGNDDDDAPGGGGGSCLANTGFVGVSSSSTSVSVSSKIGEVEVAADHSNKLQKVESSGAGVANIMKFFGGKA